MPYPGETMRWSSGGYASDQLASDYYKRASEMTKDKTIAFKSLVFFGLLSRQLEKGRYADDRFVWDAPTASTLKEMYLRLKGEKVVEDYRAYCPYLEAVTR